MLTYSTVIVTRNRPDALALSLPLILAQSRPTREILVVDSSDDPSANRALVERHAAGAAIPVRHMSSPPGMTIQRNIGLAEISGDVVLFPDDDSLYYPDALEKMMRVYERDEAGLIGGVCGRETNRPPEGAFEKAEAPVYERNLNDRLRARIGAARLRLEETFFPEPFRVAARRLYARLPTPPAWLAEEDAATVEWMTGFRMSFRTECAREVGFNEMLGRYALYEDVDAGLAVLRRRMLVRVQGALVYHHRSPERRSNGREFGMANVLNRGYVVRRSAGASALGVTRAYARLRIAQFALGASSAFGRARVAGAVAAYRALPPLFAASDEALDEAYLRLRAACLAGRAA